MVAELAQALCRQPNRGDVGPNRQGIGPPNTRTKGHAEIRRGVDVLLCVLSAGSQLRSETISFVDAPKRLIARPARSACLQVSGSPSGLELGDLHKVKLAIETADRAIEAANHPNVVPSGTSIIPTASRV